MPSLLANYKKLHSAPELSHHEEKTSAFVAKELRSLGYDVSDHVGKYDQPQWTGYGVVGVLRNGRGPTVLVRTELDALPVEENTGLPYASKVRGKNDAGEEVPVMHACGHDIHMTSLLGAAKMLVQLKDQWRGTLVLIGQPAEETIDGAKAMLNDGLYARFPRPDYALAQHVSSTLPAGKVGLCAEYALAADTILEVTVRGISGHGSRPELTKDPIVVAAQFILALQTIVSRETSPFDPAVVTVGSIHGGMRENIIPERSQDAIDRQNLQGRSPPEDTCLHRADSEEHRPCRGNSPGTGTAGKSRSGLARDLQRPRADAAISGRDGENASAGPRGDAASGDVERGFLPLRLGGKAHSDLLFLARGRRPRGSGEERKPELRCRRSIRACLRPSPNRQSGRASWQ